MVSSKVIFLAIVLAAFVSVVKSQDGYATGTTGGNGGSTYYASTEAQLRQYLENSDEARIVKITAFITLTRSIVVGSNKSILGAKSGAGISTFGFHIYGKTNIIIRGLKIYGFKCTNTPTVDPAGCRCYICHQGVQIENYSTKIWIDHNEFYAQLPPAQVHDYYTMGVAASTGSDLITVSYNKFHDIYHTSLIGHSDNNYDQDHGRLRVTYHHNYFYNCAERLPMLRYGTGHHFNNVYEKISSSGLAAYDGAQILVENCVFINASKEAIKNTHPDVASAGYAFISGNSFDSLSGTAISQTGSRPSLTYSYSLTPTSSVYSTVTAGAGQTVAFP